MPGQPRPRRRCVPRRGQVEGGCAGVLLLVAAQRPEQAGAGLLVGALGLGFGVGTLVRGRRTAGAAR
jgi:hypothetical protein